MHRSYTEVREETLHLLGKKFDSAVMVELSKAGPAVGIGRSTWHHLHSQGEAPFRAVRIGNKRYVNIADLADFVAGKVTGEARPTGAQPAPKPAPCYDQVAGEPAFGRPSRHEEDRALELGFSSVKLYRAAQRAKMQKVMP